MKSTAKRPDAHHSPTPFSKRGNDTGFFGVQAKLKVNKPGDHYEAEADQAAERVVNNKSAGYSTAPINFAATSVQRKGEEETIQEKPIAQTVTPFIQRKEDENVQAKEEESVQAKEEEVQAQEEDVQLKESEVGPAGMAENAGEEDPIRAEQVQAKTEDEPVQAKEEEEVQAKEDGEDVQLKQIKAGPAGMDDNPGEEDPIRAAQVQRKSEDESVQAKEEEEVQAKEEENVQLQEEEPASDPVDAGEDTAEVEDEVDDAEESEDVQLQAEEDIQAKEDTATPVEDPSTTVDQKLKDSKGSGSPLSSDVKTEMESGFGADFGNVKVHTGTQAQEMSSELGAQAFTHKGDIYFNQGKYNPASKEGKTLLAHELTHTIQQGASTAKDPQKEKEKEEEKSTAQTDSKSGAVKKAIVENQAAAPGTAENAEAPGTEKATSSSESAEVPSSAAAEPAKVKEVTPGVPGEVPPAQELLPEQPEAEAKEPQGPESDPNFQEVVGKIGVVSEEQQKHVPAGTLSEDAQEAAVSPSNERKSMAQANQVDEMEQQEPQPFSASVFKQKLMEKIASMQLPENQDEADNFDDNNNIDEINKSSVEDVKSEKDQAAGPIEQSSKAAPNTAAVPARNAKPLKPEKPGPKPKGVGASKAVPGKRSDEQVSAPIQNETQTLDQKMAENNVTDHQLAISNEPKFEQALDSKETAKENAQTAPQEFRQQEAGALQGNEKNAEKASQNQLAAMHNLRGGAFNKVLGDQKSTGQKDTSERAKISGKINEIYEKTKSSVTSILDNLESTVSYMFKRTAAAAKRNFEKYVEIEMAKYKLKRYSGIGGGLRWTKDLFMGLPDEVNNFFVEGKEVFVKTMDVGITLIAEKVASELNRAKSRIQQGKDEVNKYVESLPKNLKHLGKEAADEIKDKFAALEDDVNSKQDSLIDTLAQEYMATLEEVDARIEEMKEANKGLVDAAMGFINGVIDTINKLVEMITNLFAAIQSVIPVIIADPIGFMGQLFDGIGKGIDLFKANIQKHLLGGLIEWLTGSLGPMGIAIPDDIFSLKGIFSLLMQVLGLSWDYIRLKAVKMMGEPVVKALEGGFQMFTIFATKGIDGIWEYLKEQFNDLKETVIESIKSMLITQVIEAGIKWLLSLLIPGAGFIKAIMAIKDLIVFFVESAIMLIPAITEAILALATGNLGGVAKAIEFGLAKLISLVIGLFAKLIGLGGLSKKVMAIFKKIRKRVDRAIMKLLNKAKKAGRKLLSKIGGKKKPTNPKEHDMQVKAGLQYIDKISKTEDKDNNKALTLEEAKKVAAKTKKKFPVFTSVTPRNEGGKWVYDWKGSGGTKKTNDKVEGQDTDLPKYKLPAFNSSKASGFDAIITKETPKGEPSNQFKGNLPGWDAVRAGKADGEYVRTHLLHDELGGKATASNLTPTKTGLNSRFYHAVEKYAEQDKQQFPIWYRVNVRYHAEEGFTEYISNINGSYGKYEKKDGKWMYGKTLHKFVEDSPKPIFGERVYNLNSDGAKNLSAAEIDYNFADLITRERKENGKFKDFEDFDERMQKRNKLGRVLIPNFISNLGKMTNLEFDQKLIY